MGIEDEYLVKAMDVFGGGLGAHGEVCGAVIGGLAAIGLLYGRPKPGNQTDMKIWKYSGIFMKRFREEVADGKILCRNIVNVDWKDMEQVNAYREGDKREYCRILTGKTAKLVGEILENAQAE